MSSSPSPPATLAHALAEKIRELLVAQNWSQREFARRLGVTQGAVSYLLAEKRRATVLDYYERLAEVCGLSLSTLIADLEHRVAGKPTEGALDAASGHSTIVVSTATTAHGRAEVSDIFRTVLQSLVDARVESAQARIDAHVEAALAEFDRRRAEQTTHRRRRPPQQRAAGGDPPAGAVRASESVGDALPTGRDSSAGSLRRTG